MESLVSLLRRIFDYLDSLSSWSLLFFSIFSLFIILIAIVSIFFILLKIFRIKFMFRSEKNKLHHANLDTVDAMFYSLQDRIEKHEAKQIKLNREIQVDLSEKLDKLKSAALQNRNNVKNLTQNFDSMKVEFDSLIQGIKRSLTNEKEETLKLKEELEKYQRGLLYVNSRNAVDKILINIIGIQRDSNLNEKEKKTLIEDYESVLATFDIERIQVKIGQKFNDKNMEITNKVLGSGEKVVSKVIEYGYFTNSQSQETKNKVIKYCKVEINIKENKV